MRIVDIPTEPTPKHLVEPKIQFHKLIVEVDCLLRTIAKDDPRYELLLHFPLERVKRLTEPVRMGRECKSCRYKGRTYYFSNEQAPIIRTLWLALLAGHPRVHEKTLIARHKADADELGQKVRIVHTFRSGKVMHPAVGEMVQLDDGWWWIGGR